MTATAMATSSTPSVSVAARALRMRTATASATMSTTALAPLTPAGFATAPVRSMPAVFRFPSGDCDCDGNQLDALGVCGGTCTSDADGDGICDDVDDCVGTLDACGICNGPGEIYACGCAGIPSGDCDCDGNQLDALGVCGGTCTSDADGDGICDDVDDCVGTLDACGICNGPGEIYACGCSGNPIRRLRLRRQPARRPRCLWRHLHFGCGRVTASATMSTTAWHA